MATRPDTSCGTEPAARDLQDVLTRFAARATAGRATLSCAWQLDAEGRPFMVWVAGDRTGRTAMAG